MTTAVDKVEFIKRIIATSPDIPTDDARRYLLWFIDQTEGLTKSTVLAAGHNRPGGIEQAASHGVHDMFSCNGRTHLDDRMEEEGIEINLGAGCSNWSNGYVVYYTVTDSEDPRDIPFIKPDYEAILRMEIPGRTDAKPEEGMHPSP